MFREFGDQILEGQCESLLRRRDCFECSLEIKRRKSTKKQLALILFNPGSLGSIIKFLGGFLGDSIVFICVGIDKFVKRLQNVSLVNLQGRNSARQGQSWRTA